MSGGVDSSVAAALLKEQGYEVTGLFMRNWHETDDAGFCTAEQDFFDVRQVCARLDIPYFVVDFSKEYMDRVFKLFVEEYKLGRTPNPDVLCNREIKFDAFAGFAKSFGADYIATGHYARREEVGGLNYLCQAKDRNKCQTYFLNQLKNEQLNNVLFPLGDIADKSVVRKYARDAGLDTAEKKDSTGICFIGERKFREFLSEYIPMKQGDIRDLSGNVIGKHNGVYFYTIGQRKGLGIGGGGSGEPYFVVDKDVFNNVLYVTQGNDQILYSKGLTVSDFNFISEPIAGEMQVEFRLRHRQPLQRGVAVFNGATLTLTAETPQRGVALGQYAVLYIGEYCIGGGSIESKF
jgi:tRNA-specific 2-thiouridylase